MDSSTPLSALQRALLKAFFAHTQAYFLTGGAALAGFHLHHRTTDDLDLFCLSETDPEEGKRGLLAAAAEVGAEVTVLQESPDFRRAAVSTAVDTVVVDLVVDRVPQLDSEKLVIGGLRVDTRREIAANKVCALLGRTAPRDLFDLKLLLEQELTVEAILADAAEKDGAVDPASLAWVLERYHLPPTAPIPDGTSRDELNAFRTSLIKTLTRLALPKSGGQQ